MENCKIDSIYKIGDKVKIIVTDYYAYYGFSDSILIVKDIKISESDNSKFNNRIILKLETTKGKSIEGESIPIWIYEEDVDFVLD
jgi:hypothetical protein